MPEAVFDLAAYTRTAHGSHRDAIGEIGDLTADELALVRLLRDLESATMPYLRRVLVTPTHKDARVTAFLVTWAFEKFWIADALGAMLEQQVAQQSDAAGPAQPAGSALHGHRRARRGPVARAVGAFFAGPALVAAHLVALAVSDVVTRGAYARLAATTSSAGAAALCRRLEAVDARQGEFLRAEASARLATDAPGAAHAARLAARELRDEAFPLGLADRPAADRARFARFTFPGGASDALATLEPIAALPGVEPATIDAVARHLVPRGS
ncbi:hypothetical protein FLP10_14150 [Agromyces intestinalis]|uniref:Uncharacterized protein n=1 Tax=Agromyces intestinalis TaxID=2592652 RepID=A0A5C1YHK5_9MICO|nr:hypothetical protein [Agromyces intestinalis]QEO15443.1 hypothetical protein FLP10_14150 [Agromyces intestinalis]